MSETETLPKSRRPWFLTVCGALVVLALMLLPWIAGEPGAKEQPDWVRFAGHFHPVLLHLPIGVFILICIQEAWRMVCFKRPGSEGDSLFPLFFGVVSAILAVLAGFLLYHGHPGDYAAQEDGIAERHLWGGLVFSALTVVVYVAKAWEISAGSRGWCYRGLLFLSVGIMGIASHDGASMTHGEDFLTKYAPEPIRKLLGLPEKQEKDPNAGESAPDPVVYAELVAPILERRCVQCHKPGKVKGKLRMDSLEMLLKGGSEGPAIVAGSSADSLMIRRIQLPEDDEEHMPPKGKSDIMPHELVVLKWWIDQGAHAEKRVSELSINDEVRAALPELGAAVSLEKASSGGGAPETSGMAHDGLKKQVADLAKQFPGAVALESQSSNGVTFTAVSMRGKFGDEDFSRLLPLMPDLVTADFSATKISDESVALLKSATRLRQLRLAETQISDAALPHIATLPGLESLNLYGTAVGDEGVKALKSMKQLRKLYLWRTEVTPAMMEELRGALPDCEIVSGVAGGA